MSTIGGNISNNKNILLKYEIFIKAIEIILRFILIHNIQHHSHINMLLTFFYKKLISKPKILEF